ncbi:MAG: porin [Taibaiella sp.]|nr:porin [Taibaiella sp.]
MLKILPFSILLIYSSGLAAQEAKQNALEISGFAEVYYQYDGNNPERNTRPGFIYSHHRNNEVNINLAFIKAGYATGRLRANLALATGTYMNANYAEEPGVLKNIYEADIGVKISRHKNLWIDAGVFPSHIGFESAVVKDNWTVTRSMAAENSPYFETGAKISYTTDNGKWLLSALLVNGWQRIQQRDGNSSPSFGHQLSYTPNKHLLINSSSFIGSDQPDSSRQMRYFHNLYGIYKINNQWAVRASFDIGAEQKAKGSSACNTWYTTVLIARYSPTEKFRMAVRGEYYRDRNGVKIATGTRHGFQTFGYSLNADYQVLPNLVWSTEIKNLSSKDAIFEHRAAANSRNSTSIATSMAINF